MEVSFEVLLGSGAVALGMAILAVILLVRWYERRLQRLTDTLRGQFSEVSFNALQQATGQLTDMTKAKLGQQYELGEEQLENKRQLIDQHLHKVTDQLEQVAKTVRDIEKSRITDHVSLTESIKATQSQTSQLIDVTHNLKQALSSSQSRGQWGERIAEDILQHAGFVEGINYSKQQKIAGSGSKPDFTFTLPRGFTLNMDVKFPFANYLKMLKHEGEGEQLQAKRAFFADVKYRIKEIAGKDYINQEQNTVSCVLMFVPNEQVFTYIQQENGELFEQALQKNVVVCSPMTLFAVLAVIRQAVQNFAVEQKSQEILQLMQDFRKQWQMFTDRFDTLDQRISAVRKEFDNLSTTRIRGVERPLRKIEKLSESHEPLADAAGRSLTGATSEADA